MTSGVSAGQLFPEPPVVAFQPEAACCPDCGRPLRVLKTRLKRLVTLAIGALRARETVLFCPCGQRTFVSDILRQLCPAKGTFGFDVLVYVGRALFQRNRSVADVRQELREKNVAVSAREVGHMGKKFIVYLALAHRESLLQLNTAIQRRGGYILHIDGTCEGDSPTLFAGLDELSGVVLECVKIPTEKAAALIPFLEGIRERFGIPLGLSHDMGRGILASVAAVFPGVADFICHFHFLRDLGKDLLGKDYQNIRNGLKRLRVRTLLRQKRKAAGQAGETAELGALLVGGGPGAKSASWVPAEACRALLLWILDYPSELNGYGFPFDRPHFVLYQRLEIARILLRGIGSTAKGKGYRQCRGLRRLLETVAGDAKLARAAAALALKAAVFDELRQALRIALPDEGHGLNDDGPEPDIKTMEQRVTAFRKKVTEEPGYLANRPHVKMISQIDQYWAKLFADPLPVQTPEGLKFIQPQRTNNIMERFFRNFKRDNRHREGTSSLAKTLRGMLADTPLVKNLASEEYEKMILDGCATLEERFAKIDSVLARQELAKSQQDAARVSPEMKKLIRRPDFQQKMGRLFAAIAK